MRRLFIAGMIAGMLPIVGAGPASADTVGAFARGNYSRTSAIAATCRRGVLDVKTTSSGTTGRLAESAYDCSSGGWTGDFFNATASCLVVSGHTAVISGHIDSAGGMYVGYSSIREIVQDNSTPSTPTTPDRAINQAFMTQPSCSFSTATQPVTGGDIAVGIATG